MANLNNLSNEIVKALKEYTDKVVKGVEIAKIEVAKKAVSRLKIVEFKKGTGAYSKGWRVKNDKGTQIIYNKTNYQLTHLLEFGHAKVNGGRVDAIPHIRPVEEQAIKEFEKEVRKVIEGWH